MNQETRAQKRAELRKLIEERDSIDASWGSLLERLTASSRTTRINKLQEELRESRQQMMTNMSDMTMNDGKSDAGEIAQELLLAYGSASRRGDKATLEQIAPELEKLTRDDIVTALRTATEKAKSLATPVLQDPKLYHNLQSYIEQWQHFSDVAMAANEADQLNCDFFPEDDPVVELEEALYAAASRVLKYHKSKPLAQYWWLSSVSKAVGGYPLECRFKGEMEALGFDGAQYWYDSNHEWAWRYNWDFNPEKDILFGVGASIYIDLYQDGWRYVITVDGKDDAGIVTSYLTPSEGEGLYDSPVDCAREAVGYLKQSLLKLSSSLPTLE